MNFLIFLLTFSAVILPLISSLILDYIPKFKLPQQNSDKPLDCIPTNNKFYTVWQCPDFVGFVSNSFFKSKSNDTTNIAEGNMTDEIEEEQTVYLYHGKVSHIVSVENDTFLLLPTERALIVIVNDDMDKFEKYSIDLKHLPWNLTFEKFSALKNGDFITFALWLKERAADFDIDYMVLFDVGNRYKAVKKDNSLMIYEKQILQMDSVQNFHLRQNLISGLLNLFVATKDGSVKLYETPFDYLNFTLKKSLYYGVGDTNLQRKIVFHDDLMIVTGSSKNINVYQYLDSHSIFTGVCNITMSIVSPHITIMKNDKIDHSFQEYLITFYDDVNQNISIYSAITFDQFYLSPYCQNILESSDPKLANLKSITTLQVSNIFNDTNSQHTFRYLALVSPFFDSLETISLLPLCFSNEFLSLHKTCSVCPENSYTTLFQERNCSKTCLSESSNSLMDILYCPPRGDNCQNIFLPLVSPPINDSLYTWMAKTNNESNFCELGCKVKDLVLIEDECRPKSDFLLYDDYCTQFTDCYNCSMAYDCSWCRNGCRNMQENTSLICDELFYSRFSDNLWKFDRCERMSICGNSLVFMEPEGSISLKLPNDQQTTIPKNSFCSWEIFTFQSLSSEYVFYNIIMNANSGFLADPTLPYPKMSFCLFSKENPDCFTWPLDLNFTTFSVNYRVFFKRFKIVLHFPSETAVNPGKFEIKFQRQQEFLMDLKTLFGEWVFVSVLSIFFIICCAFLLRSVSISLRRERNVPLLRRLEFELYNFETPNLRLKRLLREKIIKKDKFDGNTRYDQTECPFCLEKFGIGEDLAFCFCKHIFHYNCMEQWNRVEKRTILQCPLCKEDLVKRVETMESSR